MEDEAPSSRLWVDAVVGVLSGGTTLTSRCASDPTNVSFPMCGKPSAHSGTQWGRSQDPRVIQGKDSILSEGLWGRVRDERKTRQEHAGKGP